MKKQRSAAKRLGTHRADRARKRARAETEVLQPNGSKFTHSQPVHKYKFKIYKKGKIRTAWSDSPPIEAPAILDLFSNYEQTAQFLRQVRKEMIDTFADGTNLPTRNQRRIHDRIEPTFQSWSDFSSIRQITIDAALVLASEYDRGRKIGLWIPGAIDIHNWDARVRNLLDALGFLELTGVDSESGDFASIGDWNVLRFRSGSVADGEQVARLLSDIGLAEVIDEPEMYDALTESLVNTINHAYPSYLTHEPTVVPRWWMTAYVNIPNRMVKITTFDQGATIPGTLRYWGKFDIYRKYFKRLFGAEPDMGDSSRDGEALSLAMSVGKTSTDLPYRGRGLPSMESVIDRCVEGRLAIYSRRGMYVRHQGGRRVHETKNTEINGTLISWDLKWPESK